MYSSFIKLVERSIRPKKPKSKKMIANAQNGFPSLFPSLGLSKWEKNHTLSQNNEITTNYNDLLKNTTLTGSLFPKDFHHVILKMNLMGELQF